MSEPTNLDQEFVDHVIAFEGPEVARRVAQHIIETTSQDKPKSISLNDGTVLLNKEALRQRGDYDD